MQPGIMPAFQYIGHFDVVEMGHIRRSEDFRGILDIAELDLMTPTIGDFI